MRSCGAALMCMGLFVATASAQDNNTTEQSKAEKKKMDEQKKAGLQGG
jgi:hypothetical protein